MLPKNNRANRKDLEEVFKKGSFLASPNLSFRFLKKKDTPYSKISFISPKTVSKSAVKRNSLRRRGYRILQKNQDLFKKGIFGAFVFGKKSLKITTQDLENEINNIVKKIQ